MPLIKDKYDCGFDDADGDFIGLMLVRDKNGTPRYMETTDPALASQFFTGLPGYSNLEPQKQLQVGQGDWRAGFGQEYFDYDDEKRYYYSINTDARFKGMVICGPRATSVTVTNGHEIPVQCDFNDIHYLAAGTTLYKYTSSGLASVATFSADITDLEPFSDSYLYIALGDSTKFQFMNTSETCAPSTETDGYATFFKRVGDTMWKVVLPNELKSSKDPNANGGNDWSTATTVDTTYFNITELVEERGTLFVMKEDMPYYLDSSGTPQPLIPDLRAEESPESGKNAIAWQGRLYIPCGSQTLYEYDNGTPTNISPSAFITNNTEYSGQIMALAADAHYLFAVTDNDSKVEILAGRWEQINGSARWVWHPLAELTMTGAASAWVTTALNRRLWIGPKTAGDKLYYIAIPKNYGDVTASGNYLLQSGGEFITPWHYANFKADDKAWYKLTLTMSDTSETLYWKAYYQKLGDSEWTEIRDDLKFKVSPVETSYLPEDGKGNKPSSTMIRFKFTPITTDPEFWVLGESQLGIDTILAYYSRTPILLNYDVRAVWYPPQGKIILAQVKVADRLALLDGRSIDEEQTAASIREAIDELTNPDVAWPRAFYPPYWEKEEDTKYVKLLPPVDIIMTRDEKTNNIEWFYDLQFEVVTGVDY